MIQNSKGFTLVELMIVVAIIGILTMIAVPSYNGYIKASCQSTAGMNLQTLRTHQEAANIEYGTYTAGVHDGLDPGSSTLSNMSIPNPLAPLFWNPDDNNEFKYVVEAGSTGNIQNSYKVTVSGVGGCSNIDPIVDGI